MPPQLFKIGFFPAKLAVLFFVKETKKLFVVIFLKKKKK